MTAAQKKDINTYRNRAIVYSPIETGMQRGAMTKLDELNYSHLHEHRLSESHLSLVS